MKKIFLSFIKNFILRSFVSYKRIYKLNEPLSSSDFFPYRVDNFDTIFVLENTFAMYTGKKSNFIVDLVFFNRDGIFCFKDTITFNSFDFSVDISKYRNYLDIFGGFFVSMPRIESSNPIPKFRGYLGFRNKKDKFYSFVHGNFGALYRNANNETKSLAKISNKYFFYTPQVILNNSQDFFILNPYERALHVDFYMSISGNLTYISGKLIPPFGSFIFNIKLNKSFFDKAVPVFRSFCPSLRAIVFEKYSEDRFDVFHS